MAGLMKPQITNQHNVMLKLARRLILAILLLTSGCATPVYREKSLPVATISAEMPAELQSHLALATELDRKREESVVAWRDAAVAAWPMALAEAQAGLEVGPGLKAHREATQLMIAAAVREANHQGVKWPEVLAMHGVDLQGNVAYKSPQDWPTVAPAQEGETHGFHHVKRADGLGAPLVLERRVSEPRTAEEQNFPAIVCAPATAVVYPEMQSAGGRVVCWLHDPIENLEKTAPRAGLEAEIQRTSFSSRIDNGELPLAMDLTTPLAREFRDTRLGLVSKLAVLRPTQFDMKTGLYMLDPYQPGKIPVVLIHGLASSPMAWKNAYNELAHDPQLSGRYQFWLYFYSTGNPILLSAARLRKHLNETRQMYDPQGLEPAMDNMVLVGHSMGGLLTRSAISSSEDKLWSSLARIEFNQLQLPEVEKEQLQRAFFFEPVPGIRRAVFMATPHRGSPLGDAWYGRLGSSLVRVPSTVDQLRKDVVKLNGRDAFDPDFIEGRQSSIAQLRWENPVLKALHELPISENVAYHSIVGLQPGQSVETGGDGVVPYRSAHLEGAMTELVVPSNHSVQETRDAIVELKRILADHWLVYATEMAAAGKPLPGHRAIARGADDGAMLLARTRPEGPTPIRFANQQASAPVPDETQSGAALARDAMFESLRR